MRGGSTGPDYNPLVRAEPEELDHEESDALLKSLYSTLRSLAARRLSEERRDHTLQPTALVHEAWLRLEADLAAKSATKEQFLGLASRAMRRVLVDHARAKGRNKRGGSWRRVAIAEDVAANVDDPGIDVLALDEALLALEAVSERQARVVELRFFGGLDNPRIAEVLGVSTPTIGREWRIARAWLMARLESV